ncbi:aminopeptidase P family protein [Halomonas elongata]|uniref:Aminopeptidase P family protein n=1 Tax=Halomonas elongata (strain ATCC 33173 / DSM 2581 / NBRC 15536 / NCIMB 2198 / 1H9) TaxID=768066 RepID=E1V4W5_HALED|nr:aminopeptidase P family protein [Halomonas elongata]WBF18252.1 aminopeptidase P family protein [Halomonas elongata]WPU47104.1 aminopeptidase P family protein [Halomonas elongata DSM 2581]CBV41014.1 peptidase M24 family protein [Halomonas elongata DSM 2581]
MSREAPTSPAERLAALRDAMREHDIDAWWLPSSDPHNSEYLPEHWAGRAWLSGFDGSVGTLVVTRHAAGVWVDSRYWVQAEEQLAGSGIELMKLHPGQGDAPMQWLAENLESGATLGFDANVVTLASARRLEEALSPAGIRLRGDLDLLDSIWPDRPSLPKAPLYAHDSTYLDESRAERLARVREAMAEHEADWHPISTLDDIAWLTQLRGDDVDFNPVFLAHLLIGRETATLFVAPGKLDDTLRESLAGDGIQVAPYADWASRLAELPETSRVLVDPARLTLGTRQALPDGATLVEAFQPSTLAKGRKSDSDLEHVRHAMEEDGAALCEFFAWLEDALARGETVTELTVDDKLTAARAARPGFVSRSFSTIAAFNANGALPHYHATPEAHATIEGNGLLLIDSGGQYPGGTTDITRVVPVGEIDAAHRDDYTLVLKGTIALSRAHFPRGIPSAQLDAIARAPLWTSGRDYGHGTGHGVGYFLNVHEGPQVIAWHAPVAAHTAMQPGMITSIEPGVYRPGKWGIRIENLVANRPAAESEFGDFLRFETLTLCPIDTRCIEPSLLDASEIDWLDAYHAEVRERLAPKLEGDALAWLEKRTQPLARG